MNYILWLCAGYLPASKSWSIPLLKVNFLHSYIESLSGEMLERYKVNIFLSINPVVIYAGILESILIAYFDEQAQSEVTDLKIVSNLSHIAIK